MKKKTETTIVYRGYIGMMEKNTETTMVYRGHKRKWKLLFMVDPHDPV